MIQTTDVSHWWWLGREPIQEESLCITLVLHTGTHKVLVHLRWCTHMSVNTRFRTQIVTHRFGRNTLCYTQVLVTIAQHLNAIIEYRHIIQIIILHFTDPKDAISHSSYVSLSVSLYFVRITSLLPPYPQFCLRQCDCLSVCLCVSFSSPYFHVCCVCKFIIYICTS